MILKRRRFKLHKINSKRSFALGFTTFISHEKKVTKTKCGFMVFWWDLRGQIFFPAFCWLAALIFSLQLVLG